MYTDIEQTHKKDWVLVGVGGGLMETETGASGFECLSSFIAMWNSIMWSFENVQEHKRDIVTLKINLVEKCRNTSNFELTARE
jgi:hypothetical protein